MSAHASAEFLLINNNNTRTKLALASRYGIEAFAVVSSQEEELQDLPQTLAHWSWDHVVLASVVPIQAQLIRESFGQSLTEVSANTDLGVAIDFPDPTSIGADRLANAAAVAALYGRAPAIVVDFGTAVTFDIISPDGAYTGGVIAPGLDVMKDYLHQRTALLPEIDLEEPPAAIGKTTISAMLSGAVYGYRGLVREILAQVNRELHEAHPEAEPPFLVATGGYASLIAAGLPELSEVNEHLTLEGLRAIGHRTFPQPSTT